LLQTPGTVEVRDPQGKIVGFFTPSTFDLSKEKGLSKEEVQRRLKLPRRKLTEILADLEKIK